MDQVNPKAAMKALVETGAERFYNAEEALETAATEIKRLDLVLKKGHELEMLGALEAMRVRAEIAALAGDAMWIKAKIAAIHERCTAIADALDVDVPDARPGTRSGGGGR